MRRITLLRSAFLGSHTSLYAPLENARAPRSARISVFLNGFNGSAIVKILKIKLNFNCVLVIFNI